MFYNISVKVLLSVIRRYHTCPQDVNVDWQDLTSCIPAHDQW
jgi:hypothetical protein